MRSLILSDIHSNLEALLAVLKDAETAGDFDEVWCLGDTVGYGPDPTACIETLQQYDCTSVVGNHDLVAVGRLSADDFNSHAAAAARWTASQLSPEDVRFLPSLPEVLRREEFTLVHGSLRAPVWEYLISIESAQATFQLLESSFCFVGHSPLPFVCWETIGHAETYGAYEFEQFPEGDALTLGEERLIMNPGGVGQPRDRDPRPSYAVYDSCERTIERRRVRYEIEVTQEKMRQVGLPEPLISRLSFGV